MRSGLLTKLNSMFALCLAMAFLVFFQFTKHDTTVSAIMPFGDDPYDAIGSFGVIIGAILAMLAIVRALRGAGTARRRILCARTQFAVAAALLVTLAGDGVAMARHVQTWLGRTGATELLALMAGMLVLAVALSLLIRRSIRDIPLATSPWRTAAVIFLVAAAVAAVYPESLIRSTVGELWTLVVGILLLFVPLSVMPAAFIPFNVDAADASVIARRMDARWEWGVMTLLGLGLGVLLLAGEWAGEGAPPALGPRILVGAIFLVAPIIGILIAYGSLRRPLALFDYR